MVRKMCVAGFVLYFVHVVVHLVTQEIHPNRVKLVYNRDWREILLGYFAQSVKKMVWAIRLSLLMINYIQVLCNIPLLIFLLCLQY